MTGFFMNPGSKERYRVILRITGVCLLLFFSLALGFAVFAQADPGQEGEVPAPAETAPEIVEPAAAPGVTAEPAPEEGAAPAGPGETVAGEAPAAAGEPLAEPSGDAAAAGEETEAPAALESGPSGFEMIPEEVRRPRRGEAPRYPRDLVIGTLGRGSAPEEAYAFARNCLDAILMKARDSGYLALEDAARKEEIFSGLEPVEPRKFRIGGGREEPDGSVSFLFRFIGRDQGVAGELYLRPGGGADEEQEEVQIQEQEEEQAQEWFFDDIILEDPRQLADGQDPYQYDFSPYERLF
jgi:hypothetical protein